MLLRQTARPPTACTSPISGLFEFEPDMVVSGINDGANLGDDVLYSGTVAAAIEGRFLGLPAVAVSLVHRDSGDAAATSRPARASRALIVERLLRDAAAERRARSSTSTCPDCRSRQLKGIQVDAPRHSPSLRSP